MKPLTNMIAIFIYPKRSYFSEYRNLKVFNCISEYEDYLNKEEHKPAWSHLFDSKSGHAIATYSPELGFQDLH